MCGALWAGIVSVVYRCLDISPGLVLIVLLFTLVASGLGALPFQRKINRRGRMGVFSILRSMTACRRISSEAVGKGGVDCCNVVDTEMDSYVNSVWDDQATRRNTASSPNGVRGAFLDDSVASFSRGGLVVSMDGRVMYKTNQDRGLVAHPALGREDQAIFGIFDAGHGENGEHVASFAALEIPLRLAQHPELEYDPASALRDVFQDVNDSLPEAGINAVFGGSTAVVALIRGQKVLMANVGDSRAIVATRGQGGGIMGRALTWDQNPNLPGERERIEAAGGFVSIPEEEGASSRVWLDATKSMVGLAMARSIGDLAVKQVGVIAEPEVTEYDIMDRDEFLLLASDGVWEFISNQEVCWGGGGRQ
ncbi:unnamed protein product [Choristocarpus tenellus]